MYVHPARPWDIVGRLNTLAGQLLGYVYPTARVCSTHLFEDDATGSSYLFQVALGLGLAAQCGPLPPSYVLSRPRAVKYTYPGRLNNSPAGLFSLRAMSHDLLAILFAKGLQGRGVELVLLLLGV